MTEQTASKRTTIIEVRLAAPLTEFDKQFVQGMANRMAVSFHKYGPVSDGFPDNIDAISSLQTRLGKYAETGNTEWLMDVANFAMIEYMHPRHKGARFKATDSDQSPGRTRTDGTVDHGRNIVEADQ
jgi:hypothetical protein